jgi:hypothetical protein
MRELSSEACQDEGIRAEPWEDTSAPGNEFALQVFDSETETGVDQLVVDRSPATAVPSGQTHSARRREEGGRERERESESDTSVSLQLGWS